MATRRYMVQPGDQLEGSARVTEAVGAATATKCIELTVDLGAVITGGTPGQSTKLNKDDVLHALELIEAYITQNQWPPA